MKVPLHIVSARRERLAAWLQQRSYVPLNEVCARFHISEATARRDLSVLAAGKQIRRTPGGAISDSNRRFPSFLERQRLAPGGKQRIAQRALRLIRPDTTCFLDAGTTIFAIAEELQREPVVPLTVLTNNLPVAELLAGVEGIRVHILGGDLLPRQSVLVGPAAVKALAFYKIDIAFLGAEAADGEGVWNTREDVVELQKGLIASARQIILCADATKLGKRAPFFLAPWRDIHTLLTDATPAAAAAAGIPRTLSNPGKKSPQS
jgi:DeoR/GlpR family transcriptional regulator of sugar metabolism